MLTSLAKNINTLQKSIAQISVVIKDVQRNENSDISKHMLMFGEHPVGQNLSPKVAYKPSEKNVFDVLLTAHLSITLVNEQLDAQFFYFIIRLLQSSTCFEQRRAHHQEVKLY